VTIILGDDSLNKIVSIKEQDTKNIFFSLKKKFRLSGTIIVIIDFVFVQLLCISSFSFGLYRISHG
jgi:hypothetical protein